MALGFLTHFKEDYEAMNRVYAEYSEETRRLARTCVGVTGLARDARGEIDLVVRGVRKTVWLSQLMAPSGAVRPVRP